MSSLVDIAIEKSMASLYDRDSAMAAEVVAGDMVVNDLRYAVEDEALQILATQQPMATDLRQVVAAIHIAVELERIGDHASGIASLVERMQGEEEIESLHKLPKMAKRAKDMVRTAVDAYDFAKLWWKCVMTTTFVELRSYYGSAMIWNALATGLPISLNV
jgi:phosphate transport system protein